ncbi:MAG: AEC family transporter [Lachnospiraceae bacterium]|nr:AEC family transporter [Lachnospiraceae bacterium]
MENLVFSLNATVPIFLLMVLGYVFHKLKWIDDVFASKMNKFVFTIPLPVLVFKNLAEVDFREAWNGRFVLFCFLVTVISICIAIALSFTLKDKANRGEFVQSSYRSSAALLGIAFIQTLYGTSGLGPLMIIGSVPLYNIMAVIVLSLLKPEGGKLTGKMILKTLKGIVTNPILIGIFVGIVWSLLKLPLTGIPSKVVTNVANVATPMGLIAMGATFDFKKAFGKLGPSLVAAFMKLVGFAAVFLPMAIYMGYRNEELVAILVMLGSATTVSCFVMAKNMGHEGVLSSSVVMLTTLVSAFTLTGWLWLLRSLGYI